LIARTWNGRVPARHAHGFEQHLLATGVAEAARLPGYTGAQVLRADGEGYVEFRLITYWESWEPIRHFAGQDAATAVLYPGDEEYQLIPDLTVTHHRVTAGYPLADGIGER
jgi:heme-degrading monooxygenase HmoA